ncbi:MAG TPA: hypothetical protein VIL37_12745 [Natronosporangium sp.]
MAGDDIAAWSDFGVGVIGASAALTGLLFVAVSINLQRILAYPALPARAGQTLVFLAAPVILAMLLLVPEQSTTALGLELVVLGALVGLVLLALSRSRTGQERIGSYLLSRLVPSLVFSLAILVAGLTLLLGGPGGLRWLLPAVMVAIVAGLLNAWVLLVEILR